MLCEVKKLTIQSACYKRLRYFITKFLSRYLFLWGHELASSFRLFRLHKFFLQMITNFSKIHKLHLLLTLLYGLHCLMILHLMVKGLLLSLSVQMCFDSSVSFLSCFDVERMQCGFCNAL